MSGGVSVVMDIAEQFGLWEGEPEARAAAAQAAYDLQKVAHEERILLAAQAAHEVNRAYCFALGDSSQVAWEDAPQWQRDSAIAGVRFHHANPTAGPSASHESWLAQKVADGWVYGETKDTDAKTHPCMVPFERLPFSQQAKDVLFQTTVWGVLTHYQNED